MAPVCHSAGKRLAWAALLLALALVALSLLPPAAASAAQPEKSRPPLRASRHAAQPQPQPQEDGGAAGAEPQGVHTPRSSVASWARSLASTLRGSYDTYLAPLAQRFNASFPINIHLPPGVFSGPLNYDEEHEVS